MTSDADRVSVSVSRAQRPVRDVQRSYKILVDGELVGTLKREQTLVLALTQGQHRIQARIDWTGSRDQEFDLSDGQPCHVEVAPNGTLIMAFRQFFTRSEYLVVREITS